jgi:hypothetical protein
LPSPGILSGEVGSNIRKASQAILSRTCCTQLTILESSTFSSTTCIPLALQIAIISSLSVLTTGVIPSCSAYCTEYKNN